MKRQLSVLFLLMLAFVDALTAQRATAPVGSLAPTDLFQTAKITTVHLEFTQADYKALAPHTSNGMFGFGGGGSQSWLQGAEGKRNGFAASRGVEFFGSATGAKITSLNVWTLKSIWN